MTGSGEEISQRALGLCGSSEEGSELTGEVGFSVGAGDAYRVDGGLVVRGVLDEFAGKVGIREGRLARRGRSEGEELALLLDGIGEGLLEARSSRMLRSQGGELAPCLAVTGAREAKGAIETTASGVGDDRVGRVRMDLSSVELVDAPALDAVLEGVLLRPSAAHDADEPRSVLLGDGDEVDLSTLGHTQRDAPHAPARLAEIGARIGVLNRLAVELEGVLKGGCGQKGEGPRCMAGQKLADQTSRNGEPPREVIPPYFSVKEAVFPFNKFPGVDSILGPEMRSTGEVMGVGRTFGEAMLKSQLGAGSRLPTQGTVVITVKNGDKARAVGVARDLVALGFAVVATKGTAAAIAAAGVPVKVVNKVMDGRPHIADMVKGGEIALVFTTVDETRTAIADSRYIRTAALANRVTYYTTMAGCEAATEALKHQAGMRVYSLQELHAELH